MASNVDDDECDISNDSDDDNDNEVRDGSGDDDYVDNVEDDDDEDDDDEAPKQKPTNTAEMMVEKSRKIKIILIPGMGCTPIESSNWYLWFYNEMQKRCIGNPMVQCELYQYPDPYKCRESVWVPYVRSKIDDPSQTILIGHSTGAACAMRLLEQYGKEQTPIYACILVATAHTDLNDDDERDSEYFNRPWGWEHIQKGCKERIVIFHGKDDPLIPVEEARYIAEKLGPKYCEYRERDGQSHFFQPWEELLHVVDSYLTL
jgi:uncharacterized protein